MGSLMMLVIARQHLSEKKSVHFHENEQTPCDGRTPARLLRSLAALPLRYTHMVIPHKEAPNNKDFGIQDEKYGILNTPAAMEVKFEIYGKF